MEKKDRGKAKKFFLFLGICIFLMLIFTNNILAAEKLPVLRVGIFLNQTEINIGGDGTFKIYNSKSNNLVSEERNKIVKLLPHDKGIEILGKGVYSGPINIIPVGNTKIIVIINGQKYRYRGNIEIVLDKDCKKLNVINIIGIEEYLYGVLKKEISPLWPAEVLKAQAIAARTFATFNINKHIDQGYNLCATTHCQVYGGINHEDTETNRAVDETRGLIMVYKGKPINASYHSDSGGYTEDSENVWGSFLPYLRSVESKFEEKVSPPPPHHTWSYSINEKDLTEKLQKQGYEIDTVVSIKPVKKSKTGRISELAFISKNNKTIYMKSNDLRKLIGPDLIRSTLFNIKIVGEELIIEEREDKEEPIETKVEEEKEETFQSLINKLREKYKKQNESEVTIAEVKTPNIPLTFLFSGSGNGHGVGMSQWGAYGMALQGSSYQDILKYYYQGINIIKKY